MDAPYLTIQGDKVLFNYDESFAPGEYDDLHGEFDLADYRKGLEKLNGSGNCELSGENCSMKIVSKDGLIGIIFSEGNKSVELFGLDKKNLA